MTDVQTHEIVITNQLPTKATFGIVSDKREQCYIPASIAHAVEMQVGGTYHGVIVPNTHESADRTPWLAVRIEGSQEGSDPTQRGADEFSDVFEALKGVEFPVTPEEIGVLRHRLERAWRKGKIIKVEARHSPDEEPRVLFAPDWDTI